MPTKNSLINLNLNGFLCLSIFTQEKYGTTCVEEQTAADSVIVFKQIYLSLCNAFTNRGHSKMYKFLLGSLIALTAGYSQQHSLSGIEPYIELISPSPLSSSLHFFSSDYFEGRKAGSASESLAAEYLASCYGWFGIPGALKKPENKNPLDNYIQPFSFSQNNKTVASRNIVAFIEGSDPQLKKDAILIVAHYDHLGKDTSLKGDFIYNGAADDGSGSVALLHIARSFAEAKKKGNGPKRSIIFLHAGAEEVGSRGSYHYANYAPLWPLERTTAVINMDGVGGLDKANLPGNTNYVYLLYVDSTSNHLLKRTKQLNTSLGIPLDLLSPKNPGDFQSDNRPFESHLVPALYFSSGLTEHYHKVSDEASTIDYDHMTKIVKLVFALSWDLSNAPTIPSAFNRDNYQKTGKYYCRPCGCSKDSILFDGAGICDACRMDLSPVWLKKR